MPTNKFILLFIYCSWSYIITGCQSDEQSLKQTVVNNETVNVIFETDMGNDVDDAMALDMLYKYMDSAQVNLLAINTNKNSIYSAPFISLMNKWYGYDNIPVGEVIDAADSENDSYNYAKSTYEYTLPGGQKAFAAPDTTYDYPPAVQLYRKTLAAQPDSSIVVISVGFSTNLAQLLASPPDSISSLGGRELVAKKVKLLSVMAGNFEGERMVEYNVLRDIPAAAKLFEEWPGKIVVSPFELGISIEYPATSIQNDFTWTPHHPLVVAYNSYLPMPYDRPTWDLTSVLYAVEGTKEYFTQSEAGKISVDQQGYTSFNATQGGNHYYLKVNEEQRKVILNRFIELITRKPKYSAPAN